jgi:Icc-related predicted phosphoesterase
MVNCFFVSDLHGHEDRYLSLFETIKQEKPAIVFIGGDILLSGLAYSKSRYNSNKSFLHRFLIPSLEFLKYKLKELYPHVFLILGNDDVKSEEPSIIEGESKGVWEYIHNRKKTYFEYSIFGYAFVPPTPFQLKDWERYDVSRYTDPECIAPEDGIHSIPVDEYDLKYSTIKEDLNSLAGINNLDNSIFLFHSPPHNTNLDCANLKGMKIDNVELILT